MRLATPLLRAAPLLRQVTTTTPRLTPLRSLSTTALRNNAAASSSAKKSLLTLGEIDRLLKHIEGAWLPLALYLLFPFPLPSSFLARSEGQM